MSFQLFPKSPKHLGQVLERHRCHAHCIGNNVVKIPFDDFVLGIVKYFFGTLQVATYFVLEIILDALEFIGQSIQIFVNLKHTIATSHVYRVQWI